MTYQEQLNSKEWDELRDLILDRDNNQCQICLSEEHLHVHHKTYLSNRLAWEYPHELLITLCGDCHAKFHGIERHKFKFKEDITEIAERISKSLSAVSQLKVKEVESFIKRTSNG